MNGEVAPMLDPEVLEMLQDAIGDSLEKIITIYIDEVPQSIQAMRTSLDQQDFATVHRLAHSLKSSSANLGAMQASALAAALELAIDDGNTDNAYLLASINKLAACFDQTRTLLTKFKV